jgi:hypothetical protein
MAMSGDTLGFLESSWNRGILSRMAEALARPAALPVPRFGPGRGLSNFWWGPVHASHLCQIGESDQRADSQITQKSGIMPPPIMAITAISAVCSSIADSFFCWAVSQSTRRSRHMPFRHRDLLFSELLHEQRYRFPLPFASV